MKSWSFPSRNNAETEGFSNAALAEFKGKPLKALAREICQNSLDAADGSGKPVRVEFKNHHMSINSFPGMEDMKKVIDACDEFWSVDGDRNTKSFISTAKRKLASDNFFVLVVSDYNTKGVSGAYSDKSITPWGSLVKGNSFSVKFDQSNAAGSYGIGKAAPFVSSYFQTVFYRTLDESGNSAALGVARLMAHKSINSTPRGEDPIRRSVGYYGEDENNRPSNSIPQLDSICKRTERGTDLFIPGFAYITSGDEWVKEIFSEIVDNFLYSIYSGKLEVVVENKKLSKDNLGSMLSFLGNKSKDARMFFDVINKSNTAVITEEYQNFHGIGSLKLRLLYANDLNKKILVVRNSGMKIARIPGLPRSISFSGFLEICGSDLNEFFRGMENPKHDAWEPNRYDEPEKKEKAKKYKEEVENWVKENITRKLLEISGDESPVDMAGCLNYQDDQKDNSENYREAIVDTVKSIDITKRDTPKQKIRILDRGGDVSQSDSANAKGTIDDHGDIMGHRRRTGTRPNGKSTGRKGIEMIDGVDTIYSGMKEIFISARIINKGNGINKLIYIPEDDIINGIIHIVSKGENGKPLDVSVEKVLTENASVEQGYIRVKDVKAKEKQIIEFAIAEKRSLALGVKAYGNKE